MASSANSVFLCLCLLAFAAETAAGKKRDPELTRVTYKTVTVSGVNIFYRSAGDPEKPAVLLLHGFPTSSHYYRNLIPSLASDHYVLAPDYPGFGYSDAPPADKFVYTFDNLASIVDSFLGQLKVEKYSIYVQDYGAPVGFRLFQKNPESIQAIISQNGNMYLEGLAPFWDQYLVPYWNNRTNATAEAAVRSLLTPATTKLQYTAGYRNTTNISPDSPTLDQLGLDRPGNDLIQLDLFYDYQSNLKLYPVWQALLRKSQPPLLAVWGKNDFVFLPAGAEAFKKDVPKAKVVLLNTGHFALEEDGDLIAAGVKQFLK